MIKTKMADELVQTFIKYFFKILVFYAPVVFLTIKAKKVPVKIVEEPAVYRGVNTYYQQHQTIHSKVLEPRVEPIPFAGPPHLSVLNGKCFSLTENSYKYELCPFHNITQREQTVRWNAFSGILGVFQGWVIVNNTFDSMLMDEGDLCPGSNPRQTKVYFHCGNQHAILSVSEPRTCHYKMDFQTPLACPLDAMIVYPVLSPQGQSQWESIEEDLWREELTTQGYYKQRRRLFMSEGLVAPDDKVLQENKLSKEKEHKNMKKGENVKEKKMFLSIQHCSNAYDELYAEVERLRKLVIPFNKDKLLQSQGSRNISMSDVIGTTRSTNTSMNKDDEELEMLRFGNRTKE